MLGFIWSALFILMKKSFPECYIKQCLFPEGPCLGFFFGQEGSQQLATSMEFDRNSTVNSSLFKRIQGN